MQHSCAYGDGQALAYATYGDPSGYAIFVQHGLIASICDADLFERLIAARLFVICPARPGYGASSPYRMNNVAAWGDIVATLADTLKLSSFDVLGISSGAPYSYAIAARMPERVNRIFILSGTPALYDARVRALWPYPLQPDATIEELQRLAQRLFFADLPPATREQAAIHDALQHDAFGVALDLKLRCNDWGFDLADVHVPVSMQHGRMDTQVPFATAERTAALLPRCRLIVREAGDHFSADMLDDFLVRVVLGGDSVA